MTIRERHEVFVNEEGIVPTCDLCNGPQYVEGDNWNGETGNHRGCEAAADLCPECEEKVDDGHQYHAGCCGHGRIDPMASEDGTTDLAGKAWCTDCGSALALTPDEDGTAQWEVM